MTTETKHTAGPWAVLQEECDNPYIRVRAALEMAREYASTALDEEREKFRGYEDIGMVASIQADLDSITDSLAALAEIERELDDERRKAAGFKWLLDQQRGVVEECDEIANEADAEIARLKDRVTELERDAARLDWIANSANSVDRPIEEGRGPWMLWPRYGTLRATRGKTLREAIDKAMEAPNG